MTNTVNHKGQSKTPVSFLLIHWSSPLAPNPAASANPPPKRINIPQGVFACTVLQSNTNHSVLPFKSNPFVPLTGNSNNKIPIAIATVESWRNSECSKKPDQPGKTKSPTIIGRLKIQRNAVKQKTKATIFSARLITPNSFNSFRIISLSPPSNWLKGKGETTRQR